MAPPTNTVTVHEEIVNAIKAYVERENSKPSLCGFYRTNQSIFYKHSPSALIQDTWISRFSVVMNMLGINKKDYSQKQPSWSTILERLLSRRKTSNEGADKGEEKEEEEEDAPHSSSSGSDSTNNDKNGSLAAAPILSSTTSVVKSSLKKRSRVVESQSPKTDSNELPPGTLERIKVLYDGMEDKKKWSINKDEEGKDIYLENIMLSMLSKKSYEHMMHSFILNPSDPVWKYVLTQEQLSTIKTVGDDSNFPALPASLQKIFDRCEAAIKESYTVQYSHKEILNNIWQAITSFGFFNQETQFNEAWVQATILDFLNMYRHGTLKDIQVNGSEMDYVTRCWVNFDRCFEDIGVPGRDRTCQATLVRINSERCITGEKPVDEQQRSVRPDFLLIKDGVEVAVGECGKEDVGGIGKKEIVERNLHVPKIMKDLLVRALSKGRNHISLAQLLKIVAINQNGNRLQVCILDSPKGYVCRLLESSEYEIPTNPSLIRAQLFPMMKLVLKAKISNYQLVVQQSQKVIRHSQELIANTEPGIECLENDENKIIIPLSLTLSNKKQKFN